MFGLIQQSFEITNWQHIVKELPTEGILYIQYLGDHKKYTKYCLKESKVIAISFLGNSEKFPSLSLWT